MTCFSRPTRSTRCPVICKRRSYGRLALSLRVSRDRDSHDYRDDHDSDSGGQLASPSRRHELDCPVCRYPPVTRGFRKTGEGNPMHKKLTAVVCALAVLAAPAFAIL